MKERFSREAQSLISSLRELPEDDALSPSPSAMPLDSLIEACIERHHIGKRTPQETILENWSRIVGESFARRCRPERIDASGTLIVQSSNATVRRELMFMEDRILTALGSMEGCQHIRRVILKAGN